MIENYLKLKALQKQVICLEENIESMEECNLFRPIILHYMKEELNRKKNAIVELEIEIQKYKISLNIS